MNIQNQSSSPLSAAKKGRPVSDIHNNDATATTNCSAYNGLQPVQEETKSDLVEDSRAHYVTSEAFKAEVKRFIEISKYFSSPLHKAASYICENRLVSYPTPVRIEYKRGGITTENIKFANLTLEPVYLKLFKLTPDVEELKFANLSLSRCKRIPPGLSFNLGVVYDNVNDKKSSNTKMIFVASRKTSTPCYQICEIEMHIHPQNIRLVRA